MNFPFTEGRSARAPFAIVVMVFSLTLAGCFFEKPAGPTAHGSTRVTLNELAGKVYSQTGSILAADLDKMSTSGEARYEERYLHARMNNHLAHPLGKVTLRVVVTKGTKVREDSTFVRDLIAAPHSDFQVTVRVKRQPRKDETWAWSLVDGNEGEDPR